jgi:hypothetical protein
MKYIGFKHQMGNKQNSDNIDNVCRELHNWFFSVLKKCVSNSAVFSPTAHFSLIKHHIVLR